MDANGDDPYDSITKLCSISKSQEEILRHCSFAGDPKYVYGSGSLFSKTFHLQPTGVPPASLPESSDQRERIAPPPEQSGEQQPTAVDDPSLGNAGDVAAQVDLGKNPNLGFRLEVESTQPAAEIEILGVRRREIFESEAGGEGGSAPKRLATGTISSLPIVIEDSAEESVSVGGGDSGQSGNGTTNLDQTQTRRVLPSTLTGAKETDATSSGRLKKKPSSRIMGILKTILDGERIEEDEKLAEMNLLEFVSRRGWTFPRPIWWPEGWEFSFNRR